MASSSLDLGMGRLREGEEDAELGYELLNIYRRPKHLVTIFMSPLQEHQSKYRSNRQLQPL